MNPNKRRNRGKWRGYEIKILEKKWGKVSLSDIAKDLNKSEKEVSQKATSLCLNQRKAWSEWDIRFLESQWGKINKLTICKRLGRTQCAVEKKAHQLSLGKCTEANLDFITVYRASRVLGVDTKKILSWSKKYNLKIIQINLSGYKKNYMVNLNDFLEWLKENQHLWSAKNIKRYGFGIEPEWLKNKIKRDSINL